MKDKIVGRIADIPKDSRFHRYIQEITAIFRGKIDFDKLEELLKKIFCDVMVFLKSSGVDFPTINVLLVYNSDQYIELESVLTQTTISKEVAKGPSTAFVVHNHFFATIYVNIGYLLENIQLGYPSFVLNLVNNYVHEILHAAFCGVKEQKIHDLEIKYVKEFLEVQLPEEFKNLKASDYYE